MLLVGVALLAGSWLLDPTGFRQWLIGVLVNLGAALVIAWPLYWWTKRLDRQVQAVRVEAEDNVELLRRDASSQVAGLADRVESFKRDLAEQIGSLADQVNATVREERAQDADLFERLASDPSEETVRAAFDRAHDLSLVDVDRGPRVAIREGQTYLRLDCPRRRTGNEEWKGDEPGEFMIEDRNGSQRFSVQWGGWADTTFARALADVALEIGGDDFQVADYFRLLGETLRIGSLRPEHKPIRQFCPPNWLVTNRGAVERRDLPAHEIPPSGSVAMYVNAGMASSAAQEAKAVADAFALAHPWGEPPF